jgi:hypothetical protein
MNPSLPRGRSGPTLSGAGLFGKDIIKLPKSQAFSSRILSSIIFSRMLDFRRRLCYNTGILSERKEKKMTIDTMNGRYVLIRGIGNWEVRHYWTDGVTVQVRYFRNKSSAVNYLKEKSE